MLERVRELRRQQTPAERLVWELLRGRHWLGLKFRRQHQIGNTIVDFYCHSARLVIELDGSVHDRPDVRRHDQDRDTYLASLGLRVIHFPNELVLGSPEAFLEALLRHLPTTPAPSPENNTDDDN
ncbi:MAG: endonuclease domain-containing protein [Chloroflexi bacterium]|nr:endonuclease domain-containing protein [Chloroflexota bacterium]